MKKLILVLMVLSAVNIFGQVSGISASKLSNYCTDPVPQNTFEFEPSIYINFSEGYYISSSRFNSFLPGKDSLNTASDLFFRFTYGAAKNLEIGFTVPSSMSNIGFGAKYKIPYSFDKNTSFGALAGLNLPLGNRGYRLSGKSDVSELFTYGVAGGLIISHFFTDDFSVDINAVAQKNFPSCTASDFNSSGIFAGADFGYYFVKGIQAIIGFNYSALSFNAPDLDQSSLLLNAGVTIERAKDFIIVLNTPVTIFGENVDKTYGFGFALTTALH